jgi:undecaprenyl diphosphate synthase
VDDQNLVAWLAERVRSRPLPRHVAIIMDGNGRWAEARGLPRVAGHREGSESVRAVTRQARRLGLEALTLYAFSSQNWQRPDEEVAALMQLLADYLDSERTEIMENRIRLNTIGETARLPGFVRERLERVMAESARNDGMVLTLALSYGGREEIVQAARAAARDGAVDEAAIDAHLWTAGLPDLDLLVRTAASGASPTSSSGRPPTRRCISRRFSGPTSGSWSCWRRWPTSRPASAVSGSRRRSWGSASEWATRTGTC